MGSALASAGLLTSLHSGQLRWDLVSHFPAPEPDDQEIGDALVQEVGRFLAERVDPDEIDATGELPAGLTTELQARGYLRLRIEPHLGGLGLSFRNAFRAIEAAASWSAPVAWLMATHNGLGAGAYLRLLPGGPLRDLIERAVVEGALFGDADTEPSGAASDLRSTVARPTADGRGYVLDGEKICIGNGPIADLLVVSATVLDDGPRRVLNFFVDTRTPGFRVRSRQQFMGLRGMPFGALDLRNVYVPGESVLVIADEDRDTRLAVSLLNHRARMFLICATSLAIIKQCLRWSRDFVNRRAVDGRGLRAYEEIRRIVAESLADAYAVESVAEWCLLGDGRLDPVDHRLAMYAAKNVSSVTCWRVLDRTMSLLAAEGYESAPSKARRGARPLPLERALRDARAFRIAGGVDFQVDSWAAQLGLLGHYYPEPPPHDDGGEPAPDLDGLSARNQGHVHAVDEGVRRLARTCRELARRYPSQDDLVARERTVILLNRVANELFTMAVVLGRTARRDDAQDLADVHCTEAGHRLADCWRRLADDREPDYTRAAAAWLTDGEPGWLGGDVLAEAAPAIS
jgi:alkylation response protein AidB-like acyl-CoA dehydrogenase